MFVLHPVTIKMICTYIDTMLNYLNYSYSENSKLLGCAVHLTIIMYVYEYVHASYMYHIANVDIMPGGIEDS